MNIFLEQDTIHNFRAAIIRYGRFTSKAQIKKWERQTGQKAKDWRIIQAKDLNK